jgi:hypothetical protein
LGPGGAARQSRTRARAVARRSRSDRAAGHLPAGVRSAVRGQRLVDRCGDVLAAPARDDAQPRVEAGGGQLALAGLEVGKGAASGRRPAATLMRACVAGGQLSRPWRKPRATAWARALLQPSSRAPKLSAFLGLRPGRSTRRFGLLHLCGAAETSQSSRFANARGLSGSVRQCLAQEVSTLGGHGGVQWGVQR